MSEINKEYEASLKSIETENVVDRAFYRPIGFRIARLLRGTGITPNMVTILSIFVGAAAGVMFYYDNLLYNFYGILFLVAANIMDCVDGQLARLTGIKSEIGRILDGFAGDVWFASIYIGLALRLGNEFGTNWFFALAILSAISHLVQANITDYYKTLHLYFISKEKGEEFQSVKEVEEKQKKMKQGVNKVIFYFYRWYTMLQVATTPHLQVFLNSLHNEYGTNFPEETRLAFRKQSKQLMRYIDLMTFNGRTLILFVIVLSGHVWAYYLFEIIVLNLVLVIAIKKHEKMCALFINEEKE